MKSISNFHRTNRCVFLLVFCFAAQASFAQADQPSKIQREQALLQYEKKQQDAVARFLKMGYKRIIETEEGDYSELVGENAFGKPMYFMTSNNKVVAALKANALHSGFDGFVLEGSGSTIGLWENGQPRIAHEMFRTNIPPAVLQTRIQYAAGQNNTIQRHATHVAGTLIGNQFSPSNTSPDNDLVRGVAFKSRIKAWDWLNVPLEMETAATADNLKAGNTSFGLNPLYMHQAEFGRYGEIAEQWDAVMCGNKEFQIVKSVGNARDDFQKNGFPQYPQADVLDGYDLLEGAGIAKNVLVVGAVNLEDAVQIDGSYYGGDALGAGGIGEMYSSWGPTDDGRIKPDLVTHGKNVFSGIETQNNTYGYYSGTSQAAAGVTGGIVLLQEYWKKKFINNMWSSTVRALLIHSIDEIDEKGPDYRNGWGVVNLQKAATTILDRGRNVIIREAVIHNAETIKLNIAATGNEDLKVTIAWTDPAGTVVPIDVNNPNPYINETAAKLVNDLDIRLIRKDALGNDDLTLIDPAIPGPNNNVLFPWIMKQQITGNGAMALAGQAERGDNSRDNVEKIEVYNNFIPHPNGGGMFQLQISHKGTLVDACGEGQPFSLIISGVSFCDDDLVFLQNQDNELYDFAGTKVLSNTIKASNIIKVVSPFMVTNADFVEYEAKDFIELLPQSENGGPGDEGFTAEYGSDFLAHIDCTNDFNQRMAFSPRDISAIASDDRVDERIKVSAGEMVVFPNPLIDGILYVQFSLPERSTLKISIYDMGGKLILTDVNPKVYEAGMNKKTLDLNALPAGTYILQALTNDNNRQIKFIKK